MKTQSVNRETLKKQNRGLALKLIAAGECTSRVELSRVMGLTKPAISSIVSELIEKKYIVEKETELVKEPGRNPVHLEIGPSAPRFAGLLIERGYAEAVLVDMCMNIEKYERVTQVWKDGEELIQTSLGLLDRMVESCDNVCAIGISSIGPVDIKTGTIVNPGYFYGIRNVRITEAVRERYGLPVAFDHDNQNAAFVEQLFGNGRGFRDILMIGIGKGVGCGLVAGGSRYHSHSGYSPEIGHLSINYHGRKCWCGNVGCLETYIGTEAIEERFREAAGVSCSYGEICRMEEGSEGAAVMEEMIENLAGAVVSVINILNCEVVLLGMESISWPERYVNLLENLVNERKFSNKEKRTLVRKARFLEKTHVLGAACGAAQLCFSGELME